MTRLQAQALHLLEDLTLYELEPGCESATEKK